MASKYLKLSDADSVAEWWRGRATHGKQANGVDCEVVDLAVVGLAHGCNWSRRRS